MITLKKLNKIVMKTPETIGITTLSSILNINGHNSSINEPIKEQMMDKNNMK